MDKLVEREAAPRNTGLATAPALATQFFLIPLAVVAVTVLVYLGFRVMIADDRDVDDYLNEIRSGSESKRWVAAYELSRVLADPRVQSTRPDVAPALVRAFEISKGDDPRVRRYLALAIGRLSPAPSGAIPLLLSELDNPDTETQISAIWALGSLGDPAAVPRLLEHLGSTDPGVRKMLVYALGALPGGGQIEALRTALSDPAPDVQWNAAVALARRGARDGLPVLGRMLDREYVERSVTRSVNQVSDADPVGEVMIGALRAIAGLKARGLREAVASLSSGDRSLKVRQAALEALRALGT